MEQFTIIQEPLTSSRPKRHKPKKQQPLSCPSCGMVVGERDKFCLSCGQALSKLCVSGHHNPINARYCVECGIDFSKSPGSNHEPGQDTSNRGFNILAKNGIEVTDSKGIIRILSLTQDELEKGIEDCPKCNNPLKVAGPGSRFLNGVPLFPDTPEDHTGALTICNKCGEVSFAGTYYEG